MDEFAEQSVIFENSYAVARPTLPLRRQTSTQRGILHEKDGWRRPTGPSDVPRSEILPKVGYRTGLATDICQYFKPGMNFRSGFDSFDFIRGQEMDRWVGGPLS